MDPANHKKTVPKRVWIAAASAAVVVLAAVLVAVYYSTSPMRGSEPERTAVYFPDDTIAYSWVTLQPGIEQGSDMKELWDRLTEIPQFEEALQSASGPDGPDLDSLAQMLSWAGPDISAALLNPAPYGGEPSAVVLIGVKDRTAALSFVSDTLGLEPKGGSVHGFERLGAPDLSELYIALSDDWLLVASSREVLSMSASRIASPPSHSLADRTDFSEARAAMRDRRALSAYVDLDGVISMFSSPQTEATPLSRANMESAVPIPVGGAHTGSIGSDYAPSVYEFDAQAGKSYVMEVELGSLPDSVLSFHGPDGSPLSYNDDYGPTTASRIQWTAKRSEKHYISVSGYGPLSGSYTLHVTTSHNSTDARWIAVSAGFVDLGIVIDVATPAAVDPAAISVLDSDPADRYPDDTVLFAAAAFSPGFMDGIRDSLSSYPPSSMLGPNTTYEQALDSVLDEIGAEIGIDLESDLFDYMSGQLLFGLLPYDLSKIDDPDRYALDMVASMSHVPLSENKLSEAVNKSLTTLGGYDPHYSERKDIGTDRPAVVMSAQGGSLAYSPSYAFHDGYMSISTTERALRSVIDTQTGSRPALSSTSLYRRTKDAMPNDLSGLVYVDLHKAVLSAGADEFGIDNNTYSALTEILGSVAIGVTHDSEHTRASLVLTLFPND